MKITESKLKQVIAEEYKKVVLINEIKQSSDYHRLVEIVGREKADLVVEGFFDYDWIPGSEANKMRKILKDLEPLAGDDNEAIDAVLKKHGVGGEQLTAAVANAAKSSSDPAARQTLGNLVAITDDNPSTNPSEIPQASRKLSPVDEKTGRILHKLFTDEFEKHDPTRKHASVLADFIENYLISYFDLKNITRPQQIQTDPILKQMHTALSKQNSLKEMIEYIIKEHVNLINKGR